MIIVELLIIYFIFLVYYGRIIDNSIHGNKSRNKSENIVRNWEVPFF